MKTKNKLIKIVVCAICYFHIRLENAKYEWIDNLIDDGYRCNLDKDTTELTPCRPNYKNRYKTS
tara:strand:+ start:755 stop:946 length:192 start_codon:yes stop_codon:yes gene_type:complete